MVNKSNDTGGLDRLSASKEVSTNLAYSLELLNQRIMSCIKSIDSTDIEDVSDCNKIIEKINKSIDKISKNQKIEIEKFKLIDLTDDEGNVVTEYKHFVVGFFFIDNGKETYYKCRIVNARTEKEALYKYRKESGTVDESMTCFGLYEKDAKYCQDIENDKIID